MCLTFFLFLSSVNTILGTVCYPGFLLVGPKSSVNWKQEDFSLLKGNFFPVNRENLGNTLLIFGESFTSAKVFPKERKKNIIHVCRVPAPHIWGKNPRKNILSIFISAAYGKSMKLCISRPLRDYLTRFERADSVVDDEK